MPNQKLTLDEQDFFIKPDSLELLSAYERINFAKCKYCGNPVDFCDCDSPLWREAR
jgi:hypothetical protein